VTVSVAKGLDGRDVRRREKEEQRVIEATIRRRARGEGGSNHGGNSNSGGGTHNRESSAVGNTVASTPTHGSDGWTSMSRTRTPPSSSASREVLWEMDLLPPLSPRQGAGGDGGRYNDAHERDNLQATLDDFYLLEAATSSFGNNDTIRGDRDGSGNGSGGSLSAAAAEVFAGLSEDNQLELAIQLSLQTMTVDEYGQRNRQQ